MRNFGRAVRIGKHSEMLAFGFEAAMLTVRNDGPAGVRVRFDGSPATAGDFLLTAGERLDFHVGPSASAVSLSSTGAADVRVGAWG